MCVSQLCRDYATSHIRCTGHVCSALKTNLLVDCLS